MGFFAVLNAFTMRSCLTVAIIRMVKPIGGAANNSRICTTPEAYTVVS